MNTFLTILIVAGILTVLGLVPPLFHTLVAVIDWVGSLFGKPKEMPQPVYDYSGVEIISWNLIELDKHHGSQVQKRLEATVTLNGVDVRMTIYGWGWPEEEWRDPFNFHGELAGPAGELSPVVDPLEFRSGNEPFRAVIGRPEPIQKCIDAVLNHGHVLADEQLKKKQAEAKRKLDEQQLLIDQMRGKPIPPATALSRAEKPQESAERGLSRMFDDPEQIIEANA